VEAEAEIENIKAMMVGEMEFPVNDELSALKGVILYPSRIKCAVQARTALANGLDGGVGS
jgi:nitrogen fixation NifU-like protein